MCLWPFKQNNKSGGGVAAESGPGPLPGFELLLLIPPRARGWGRGGPPHLCPHPPPPPQAVCSAGGLARAQREGGGRGGLPSRFSLPPPLSLGDPPTPLPTPRLPSPFHRVSLTAAPPAPRGGGTGMSRTRGPFVGPEPPGTREPRSVEMSSGGKLGGGKEGTRTFNR